MSSWGMQGRWIECIYRFLYLNLLFRQFLGPKTFDLAEITVILLTSNLFAGSWQVWLESDSMVAFNSSPMTVGLPLMGCIFEWFIASCKSFKSLLGGTRVQLYACKYPRNQKCVQLEVLHHVLFSNLQELAHIILMNCKHQFPWRRKTTTARLIGQFPVMGYSEDDEKQSKLCALRSVAFSKRSKNHEASIR